ncbi:hypothetical protein OR1_03503 [Geobacter sp. OR-1]|uniref:hypothetical protein n=1 Tax=Geobacter sp. OR-1 TaxID=1266765 RepID=UPI000542F19A|nr:hypothetical protein [Geobacter sp. OR-1]GAM11193.1 hypothetical protein OR1_03503 [Geobacter sp. OR-1]
MKTSICRITFIFAAFICLAATPLFACGTSDCKRPETQVQDAAPAASTANTEQYQSRSREMNISDFVSGERSPEKGCDTSNCNGQHPEQQEQPRTQEKKCETSNCGG